MKQMFFIILLFNNILFSADLNTTIVDGDINTYKNLLNKIDKQKIKNDEVNLQKIILLKIIKSKKTIPYEDKEIVLINTQKNYILLFKYYLNTLFEIEEIKTDIQANNLKLETLYNQIQTQTKPLLTTQLFYASYKQKNLNNKDKITKLQKELSKIKSTLVLSLKNTPFDTKSISKLRQYIDKKIKQTNKNISQLIIKKEHYILLGQEKPIPLLIKEIVKNQNIIEQLYQKKLDLLFLDFIIKIKSKTNDIIKAHNNILSFTEKFIKNGDNIATNLDVLLTEIEQTTLGKVGTIKAQSLQTFKTEIQNIWQILQNPIFIANKTPISSFKLLLSLFIFIFGFFIGNIYRKYIKNLADKNKNINAGTHTLLANLGYYTIFIITFFIVLKVLGIDLSSIALVAGALSVGIGFGLQNIISNFVSGIILMVERSVKIGDYIELDNDLRGHVVDIKMRSITVNTNSNIDIIVPNQDLIQNRVINWTMNDKIRRFEIPFGVAYGTPPQKVIDVILQAVQTSGFKDIFNTPEKHTRIIMTGMGNSSVDFELFIWITGKEILFPKRTISRFLILIYNTLYKHNIEIPFPQQDLHIRSVDTNLPITIKDNTLKP